MRTDRVCRGDERFAYPWTVVAAVYNDPLNRTDPDGRIALQIIGGIAGGVISGAISVYKGNTLGTVIRNAAVGAAVGAASTLPEAEHSRPDCERVSHQVPAMLSPKPWTRA